MKSRDPEIVEKTLPGLRKLEDFTRRLHAVSDHAKGKRHFPTAEEDNFEALQGMYLQQLRKEREHANQPQFQGVTDYEAEEERMMQVQAAEAALLHRRERYWRGVSNDAEAEYRARFEREQLARRDDATVGGEQLVRRDPRSAN